MKKNSTMRIAVVLMVLTLMTSCFVGGTFAKYTTGDEALDEARVAKWGVTVTATGSLFGKDYEAKPSDVPGSVNLTVQGSEKVVAPGTKSPVDGVTFAITGTPEVKVEVTVDNLQFELSNWKQSADWDGNPLTADTDEEYCPLRFTVGTKTYYIGTDDGDDNTVHCDNVDKLEEAVMAAIEGELERTVMVGDALADSLKIEWSWPFDSGNDVKDTALGNLAANDKAGSIYFSMTLTVTQVD